MTDGSRGAEDETPEGTATHRREAQALGALRVAVLTVSDSRTEATDESGPLARRLLREAGHEIARHALLPNDEPRVRALVQEWLAARDLHAIVITGGTGLGSKDRSIEAVTPLFEKEIPGFGELFRLLSYQEQIGTTAILSRAAAGSALRLRLWSARSDSSSSGVRPLSSQASSTSET